MLFATCIETSKRTEERSKNWKSCLENARLNVNRVTPAVNLLKKAMCCSGDAANRPGVPAFKYAETIIEQKDVENGNAERESVQ